MADTSKWTAILASILLGLIVIVVGFYLVPTLVQAQNSTITASGSTSLAGSIAPIVVGLFVVALLGVAIALIVNSLRAE